MKGPAVLLVANYESDVGYAWWLMESYWVVAAQETARVGGQCTLAYPRITKVPESILNAPIEIVEYPIRHDGLRAILRSLVFIRERRIEAIYLTDWPYWHPCYALWRLAGVRSIVIHDHSPGSRPPAGGLGKVFKSLIHSLRLFSASRNVAVSSFVADRMVESARVPRARCIVVSNGIRAFDCQTDARLTIRSALGIRDDSVLIVLASRATHYKNIGFAIRCVHQLLQDPEMAGRVEVIHCGDGPELEEFRTLARDLGLESTFRLLGLRNDTREIMCAADIGFHPSNGEVSLCLAIMEMMCAELPVLVSDLDSVSGILRDNVTSIKYRHGDMGDALEKLRTLVEDPALRGRIGVDAARVCRKNHTLEAAHRRFAVEVAPWLTRGPGVGPI